MLTVFNANARINHDKPAYCFDISIIPFRLTCHIPCTNARISHDKPAYCFDISIIPFRLTCHIPCTISRIGSASLCEYCRTCKIHYITFFANLKSPAFSLHVNFMFWKHTHTGDYASIFCLKIAWVVAKLWWYKICQLKAHLFIQDKNLVVI